MMGSRKGKKIS